MLYGILGWIQDVACYDVRGLQVFVYRLRFGNCIDERRKLPMTLNNMFLDNQVAATTFNRLAFTQPAKSSYPNTFEVRQAKARSDRKDPKHLHNPQLSKDSDNLLTHQQK